MIFAPIISCFRVFKPARIVFIPLIQSYGVHPATMVQATTPADYTNVKVDSCDEGRAERWQVGAQNGIKLFDEI